MSVVAGSKVIISGGAGFLGRAIIPTLLSQGCEILVVSRDEAKHYYLKRDFPQVTTKICDIRNLDLLAKYTEGMDYGIWAASIKQIDSCSENPQEAKAIILDGALNSRTVSEKYLKAACFISTDKSRAPTTLYGYLKGAAGESFILHNQSDCKLSTAVYGNVWGSTGSVIPTLWHCIRNDKSAVLYHKDMTRFMIDVEHAIDLVFYALNYDGQYVIPKLPSFRVEDLFEIYADEFNLQYVPGTLRPSEKVHEVMATAEDIPRTQLGSCPGVNGVHREYFLTDPIITHDSMNYPFHEYSSRDNSVSQDELYDILAGSNFFEPQ